MTLTDRGAWVLIALCFVLVFGCLVAGQAMKHDRLAQEQSASE